MRALVTGGAGFIGSTLVDRLVRDGHEVTVVDDLSRGARANLAQAQETGRLRLRQVGLNDPALTDVVAEAAPEVVFHLAAQIDVRSSVTDPFDDATRNVLGTIAIAEAARRAGARKVVFASSGGSIYGTPEELPVDETAPLNPKAPYAASKISAEMYLNTYRELYGLDCTHLAPANVYGPRQNPHGKAGVVAIFANALLSGRPTTLFGDGGNTRDYVYVGDVVSAFVVAAGEVGGGKRYNIGTGVQTTDRELHTLVARAANAEDDPVFAPARLGDLRASALNATTAATDLGWRPTIDLTEGIDRTVDFFRRQLQANSKGAFEAVRLQPHSRNHLRRKREKGLSR